MKIFGWMFSATVRHRWGIKMYQKAGWGFRIFSLIFALAIAGGALGFEFWFCSAVGNKEIFGGGMTKIVALFFIGILLVACLWAAVEINAIYCSVCLRLAIFGVALSMTKREKLAKRYPDMDQSEPYNTSYKWFDIFCAIVMGIVALGIIAAAIAIPILSITN